MDTTTSPNEFEGRFAELTARWNAHQDLRHHCADIADLAASRAALDEARQEIRQLQTAA